MNSMIMFTSNTLCRIYSINDLLEIEAEINKKNEKIYVEVNSKIIFSINPSNYLIKHPDSKFVLTKHKLFGPNNIQLKSCDEFLSQIKTNIASFYPERLTDEQVKQDFIDFFNKNKSKQDIDSLVFWMIDNYCSDNLQFTRIDVFKGIIDYYSENLIYNTNNPLLSLFLYASIGNEEEIVRVTSNASFKKDVFLEELVLSAMIKNTVKYYSLLCKYLEYLEKNPALFIINKKMLGMLAYLPKNFFVQVDRNLILKKLLEETSTLSASSESSTQIAPSDSSTQITSLRRKLSDIFSEQFSDIDVKLFHIDEQSGECNALKLIIQELSKFFHQYVGYDLSSAEEFNRALLLKLLKFCGVFLDMAYVELELYNSLVITAVRFSLHMKLNLQSNKDVEKTFCRVDINDEIYNLERNKGHLSQFIAISTLFASNTLQKKFQLIQFAVEKKIDLLGELDNFEKENFIIPIDIKAKVSWLFVLYNIFFNNSSNIDNLLKLTPHHGSTINYAMSEFILIFNIFFVSFRENLDEILASFLQKLSEMKLKFFIEIILNILLYLNFKTDFKEKSNEFSKTKRVIDSLTFPELTLIQNQLNPEKKCGCEKIESNLREIMNFLLNSKFKNWDLLCQLINTGLKKLFELEYTCLSVIMQNEFSILSLIYLPQKYQEKVEEKYRKKLAELFGINYDCVEFFLDDSKICKDLQLMRDFFLKIPEEIYLRLNENFDFFELQLKKLCTLLDSDKTKEFFLKNCNIITDSLAETIFRVKLKDFLDRKIFIKLVEKLFNRLYAILAEEDEQTENIICAIILAVILMCCDIDVKEKIEFLKGKLKKEKKSKEIYIKRLTDLNFVKICKLLPRYDIEGDSRIVMTSLGEMYKELEKI